MHVINYIPNISSCQAELPTNYRTPNTYKAKHFRRRNRIKFEDWAGAPIVPLVNGITHLRAVFLELSQAHRDVFEMMVYMRSRGLPNYMSQQYIADKLGLSRVHVNRVLQNLKAWGFIDIYNRGDKKVGNYISNVYKVANVFMKKHIWEQLMDILPIFRSFVLMFALVQPVLNPYPHNFFWASKWWKPKNVTLLIKDDNKNININSTTTQNVEGFKYNLSTLVQLADKKEAQREAIVNRNKMKSGDSPKGGISSFKNFHKRELSNQSPKASEYLRQETERISCEQAARMALIESERGTEKEAANNAKAAENLRRLFGF